MKHSAALREPVVGPSFPIAVKVLASALVLALLIVGVLALVDPTQAQPPPLGTAQWGFLAAVCAVIGSGYWGILTSETRCDDQFIEQSWLWTKKVKIAEITQVKLISVPGFSGLIVPRLVVRTGFGLTTFHAGDKAVYLRFKLLAYGA